VGVWPWRLASDCKCVITYLLNELVLVICVLALENFICRNLCWMYRRVLVRALGAFGSVDLGSSSFFFVRAVVGDGFAGKEFCRK